MVRSITLFMIVLLLLGCSRAGQPAGQGEGPGPVLPVAEKPKPSPSLQDWQPPADGSLVPWNTLPDEVRETFARHGDHSPDGKWVAAKISPWNQAPQLWVAATDATAARLIESDMYGYGTGVWGPAGTYFYRRDQDDSWHEVDPGSGLVMPFLPDLLKGQKAGILAFSPDGKRLLYRTGLCYCNRPPEGPLTTFVANIDGTGREQVGVDVDVRWEGNTFVITRSSGTLELGPGVSLTYSLLRGEGIGSALVIDTDGKVILQKKDVLRVIGMRDVDAPGPVIFIEIAGGGSMGMYYEAYLYVLATQSLEPVSWAGQPFGISRSELEQEDRSIRTTHREVAGAGWKERYRVWRYRDGELSILAEGDLSPQR